MPTTRILRGATELADGNIANAVLMRMTLNGEILIEPVPLVRAPAITIFERGNFQNDITLEIARLHDDAIAAANFRNTHAQEICGKADFVFELTDGTSVYTATIASAGWRSVSPERKGAVGSVTSYEIVGGKFTTTTTVAGVSTATIFDASLRATATTLLLGSFDADARPYADTYDFAHA